jgi:hypothetical protein
MPIEFLRAQRTITVAAGGARPRVVEKVVEAIGQMHAEAIAAAAVPTSVRFEAAPIERRPTKTKAKAKTKAKTSAGTFRVAVRARFMRAGQASRESIEGFRKRWKPYDPDEYGDPDPR